MERLVESRGFVRYPRAPVNGMSSQWMSRGPKRLAGWDTFVACGRGVTFELIWHAGLVERTGTLRSLPRAGRPANRSVEFGSQLKSCRLWR